MPSLPMGSPYVSLSGVASVGHPLGPRPGLNMTSSVPAVPIGPPYSLGHASGGPLLMHESLRTPSTPPIIHSDLNPGPQDKGPGRQDALVVIGPTGIEHYPWVKRVQPLSAESLREGPVPSNQHSSIELDDGQGHAHAEGSPGFAHALASVSEPSLPGIDEEPLSKSSTWLSCPSGTVPLDSFSTCSEISPGVASCLPGAPDSASEFAPHESDPFTAQQPSCLEDICSLPAMSPSRQIQQGQCRPVNSTTVEPASIALFTAKKPPDNIGAPLSGVEGVKGLPVM